MSLLGVGTSTAVKLRTRVVKNVREAGNGGVAVVKVVRMGGRGGGMVWGIGGSGRWWWE